MYTDVMNIISWNVNGVRALHRKGKWDWLMEQKADIVCLQETKSRVEQLSDEVAKPKGYHAYFDSPKEKKGYSGVALYSKVEPKHVETELGVKGLDDEGRFIAAYFENFVLITSYFPNGGGGPERLAYKMDFYDAFLKYIESVRRVEPNIIFCGDVNTAHTAIDLARPKENEKNTGFLPEERAWIDSVVEAGYVDVWRNKNPDVRDIYTYWDMKTFARARNVGWRIDYFFASTEAMSFIKDIKIHTEIEGSDHCPVELVTSL